MTDNALDPNGPGLDYSLGLSNVDHPTGIHYGVIHANEVCQAWSDSSEPEYPDPELDEDGEEIEDDLIEPLAFTYDDDGYRCSQSADDPDIFILRSPYYTRCAFCSPCAPGAGYLMSPRPAGIKTYCFGHDWFDEGKAPYPVYRVTDDQEIFT